MDVKFSPTIASGIARKSTPNTAPILAMIFPTVDVGETSPYPTVVIVTTMNQIASGIDANTSSYPSGRHSPSHVCLSTP